jgi:hypothetical protein
LDVCGFHPEINLNHVTRDEHMMFDEIPVNEVFEAIHIIALYDEAYASESSSSSFLINDLCLKTHYRSVNGHTTVFMKCSNPNCPGINVTSSHQVADLLTCPCVE